MADDIFSGQGVLLVDDEPFMQMLVTRVLKGLGIETVFIADNGEDALNVMVENLDNVTVILMDLEMPKMDGFECIQHLHKAALPEVAELPIIILSGNTDEEVQRKARDVGVSSFLSKPVKADDLKEALQKTLC